MQKKRCPVFLALFVILPVAFLGIAAFPKDNASPPPPEPKTFVKKLTLPVEKGVIPLTVHAGETYLRDAKGQPTSSIFSIAYIKDNEPDPTQRPILFSFNGGPGSSSVWMNFGLLGPTRIVGISASDAVIAPPYRFEANPLTLLSVADLVFIDPVGTGYSHAIDPAKNEDFWGVDEDSRSLVEFIRLFITKFNRWNSPKFIIGESYGGTRAVKMLENMQVPFTGMYLNGVILVSPALDYSTFLYADANLVYHVTHLPAYAAAAWYHNRLPQKPADFLAFLREVNDFAGQEYLVSLLKGDALDKQSEERLLDKLHMYTGLSREYWRGSALRVFNGRFAKELLRDQGLALGTHDCRFTAKELDPIADQASSNPSITGTDGAFAVAVNEYLHRTLGVDWDRKYEILNQETGHNWKRPVDERGVFTGYLDVVPILAQCAAENRDLHIFVASGYHDLITTPWGAEYAMHQSRIPPQRVTLKHYDGGHMLYLHEPTRKKLAGDLKDFILSAKNR